MIFLHHLHQFLQRQEIGYRITIVEQVAGKDFNRAKLFNIGFIELERRFPTDCYIFHDVDLVPLRANNMYACTLQPRHMSSSINVFNYQLPYSQLFGGAVALLSKQFRRINGYSNEFFGWGGEDDDFYNRLRRSGLPLVRFEQDISRYIMIDHAKESPNPDRFEMLRHGRWRYDNDGLNDLHYAVDDFELRPLYTWILVEL
nr:EOG090X0AZ6 [Cyclestheria hislopi]